MSDMLPIRFAPMLDTLCPLHLILNATVHAVYAELTLLKVIGDRQIIGQRFLELFEIKRPAIGASMQALLAAAGTKLHLQLRVAPRTEFKGVPARSPPAIQSFAPAAMNSR